MNTTSAESGVDPLADLLPIEHPAAFDLLPDAERRWRLRAFLVASAAGQTEADCWATALHDGEAHVARFKVFLAGTEDDDLRTAVAVQAIARITSSDSDLRATIRAVNPRRSAKPRA
jgi:hypothetical protein